MYQLLLFLYFLILSCSAQATCNNGTCTNAITGTVDVIQPNVSFLLTILPNYILEDVTLLHQSCPASEGLENGSTCSIVRAVFSYNIYSIVCTENGLESSDVTLMLKLVSWREDGNTSCFVYIPTIWRSKGKLSMRSNIYSV